jgi:hypothetical protein
MRDASPFVEACFPRESPVWTRPPSRSELDIRDGSRSGPPHILSGRKRVASLIARMGVALRQVAGTPPGSKKERL